MTGRLGGETIALLDGITLNYDDPDAFAALEQLLRLGSATAGGREAAQAELTRVAHEVFDGSPIEKSVQRVAWLLYLAGKVISLYAELLAEDVNRDPDIESPVDAQAALMILQRVLERELRRPS